MFYKIISHSSRYRKSFAELSYAKTDSIYSIIRGLNEAIKVLV